MKKKIAMGLLLLVFCLGFFEFLHQDLFAATVNCSGGFQCANVGNPDGMACGTDTGKCTCQFQLFIGWVCLEKE